MVLITSMFFALSSWGATLSGIVLDHVGAAQPHAKVSLQDVNHRFIHAVVTANDGRFLFENLEPQDYVVVVEAPCFKKARRNVQVASESIAIEVQLGPESKACRGID